MTTFEILTLVGVPTLVALLFQVVYNTISTKRKKILRDDQLIKKALQALLRDRLMTNYKTYNYAKHASIEDKQNYNNMYQIYHSLGKNGVMDTFYEKVMELPEELEEEQNHEENR